MLLGNYQLLMVDSVNAISKSIKMIILGDLSFLNNPELMQGIFHFCLFLLGSVFGMVSFSRLIALIFKKHKNLTIALLTGFIFGSLATIWPWKIELNENEYERFIPKELDQATISTLCCILFGIICIWAVEKMAEKQI